MFEIGFAELFLLGVIALLVVGPDKLPGLARTVGVWVGKAQRLVGQVRADIEREVRADELRKAAKEYSPTNVLSDVKKEVEDFAGDVSKPLDLNEEIGESKKPGADGAEPAGEAAASGSTLEPPDAAVEGDPADSESGEPPAGEESKTEPATAAPNTMESAGNNTDAPAAAAPEAEPDVSEPADEPVAEAPDDTRAKPPESDPDTPDGGRAADTESAAPDDGGPLSNGQTESAMPPPVTESAEPPSTERNERTASP